jgi:GNAT superfamily N-acetyltransferase
MDVTIRRIRTDEGAVLKSVRLRALADAPYAYSQTLDDVAGRTDDEWAELALRRATSRSDATFFAEVQGAVVGMAGVFIVEGHAELVAMWIAPDMRRHGVGQQVVNAAVAWASQVGAHEICTEFAEGNDQAQRFYAACGFEPTAETRPLRPGAARLAHRVQRWLR